MQITSLKEMGHLSRCRWLMKEEEVLTGEEGGGGGGGRSMTCESHGMISVIGRRRAMEDAVTVVIGEIEDSYDFFAVYDGHGGAQAANTCRERLHLIVAKEVEERGTRGGGVVGRGLEYWEDLMGACFMKMDEEVISRISGDVDNEVRSVGSTAVVVMMEKEELVVANCGDSRALLCRGGEAVPLSRDHKVMTHCLLFVER